MPATVELEPKAPTLETPRPERRLDPRITLGRPRRSTGNTWLNDSNRHFPHRGFHDCPRCQYPMVAAKGYRISEVGSSLFAAASKPGEWLIGIGRSPTGSHARRWGGAFSNTPLTWLDYQMRRSKLARLQQEIALYPKSVICPNCLHLERR